MSTLIDTLFDLAWSQFWQITALALVVGFATRYCCRRRPHLAYVLWMLVIIKCLTPPLWSSPAGIFSWARIGRLAATSGEQTAHVAVDSANSADFRSTEPVPAASASAAIDTHRMPPIDWLRPANILGAIWLIGTAMCAGFAFLKTVAVASRLRRSALAIDTALLTLLATTSRRLKIARSVRILVTPQPVGPAVFGIIRPTLVLPQALLSAKPPIELEPIIAHELIHIRRRDTLAAMLQLIAQCLWWFHPLVWWVNRQVCCERERSCDEEVLAELKCDRATYGQGLLDIVRLKKKLRPLWAHPGVRAVEVTSRRLEHIMQNESRFHPRTPRPYWALALAVAVTVLPGADRPSSLIGGEAQQSEIKPVVTDQQEAPHFIVVPITTDLQRKLLDSDRSLVAFVEFDGRIFVDKQPADFAGMIDTPELRNVIGPLKRSDEQAKVSFTVTYSGPKKAGFVESAQKDLYKPLQQACKAVASHAGLKFANLSQKFAADSDYWVRAVQATQGIDLKRNEGGETGVGDDVVMVYAARSALSRWMAGADCVACVYKPIDAEADPLIGADIRERLKNAIAKLKLPATETINFSFVVRHVPPKSYDDVTQRIVGDSGQSGAAQELAEFLGFEHSSVTFGRK